MNRRDFVKLSPAFPAAAVTATLTLKEDGKRPINLDVSVLKLERGDTLVLSCDGDMSMNTADRIRFEVEHLLPGIKALIVADGLNVEGVLRGPKG